MNQLKEYTETELLKLINDAKRDQEEKKSEIVELLDELKNVEDRLNGKLEKLDTIEQRYVTLMQELVSRGK